MVKKKKGAIELSMGTIVILVLAMTMLIMGLVLIKTIFSGAKYNVEQINQKVEGEIGKLFSEDKQIVIMQYDGENKEVVYAGPFNPEYFGISPDWNLMVVINLNPQNNEYGDLYSVGIR